jgi:hypothetical protein
MAANFSESSTLMAALAVKLMSAGSSSPVQYFNAGLQVGVSDAVMSVLAH